MCGAQCRYIKEVPPALSGEVLDLLPFLLTIQKGAVLPFLAPFLSLACSPKAEDLHLNPDVWRAAVADPACLLVIAHAIIDLSAESAELWAAGNRPQELQEIFEELNLLVCFLNSVMLSL